MIDKILNESDKSEFVNQRTAEKEIYKKTISCNLIKK